MHVSQQYILYIILYIAIVCNTCESAAIECMHENAYNGVIYHAWRLCATQRIVCIVSLIYRARLYQG